VNNSRPHRKRLIAVAAASVAVSGLALAAYRGGHRGPVVFERTAVRVARGRYLVWGTPHCVRCHSELQRDVPGGHPIPGREFAGIKSASGRVAPNLTPDPETGAGNWTDQQLVRAIRQGIGHDGRQLTAFMPWNAFSALTDEDVKSIVVYLRSIPPVRNPLPKGVEAKIEDVIRDRVALVPPVTPAKSDYKNDPVRRGEYLARIGVCANCHTPVDADDRRMVSYRLGGGRAEGGIASNITPDPSGIAHYDENLFIQTMRTGKVGGVRELKGGMTWWYLGHLTDDDLRAIFAYLKTVPPVKHRVSTSEEETLCPVCGRKHGFGDLNVPSLVHPVIHTMQNNPEKPVFHKRGAGL
jgi:mono/diheme cytochrome c family protein